MNPRSLQVALVRRVGVVTTDSHVLAEFATIDMYPCLIMNHITCLADTAYICVLREGLLRWVPPHTSTWARPEQLAERMLELLLKPRKNVLISMGEQGYLGARNL